MQQNINVKTLAQARDIFNQNPELKRKAQSVLNQYAANEKIDFLNLKDISDAFGVKSVLLITSYVTNDKVNSRRNIWDILEITSAFKTSYPFELKTSAVLTDSVNNIVMWSGNPNSGYVTIRKNQTIFKRQHLSDNKPKCLYEIFPKRGKDI